MSHSTGQVLLVFAGAALVSVVLIAFVNAEASHRKGAKEPEIANGNLFSATGHRVKRLVRQWWIADEDTKDGREEVRMPSRRLAGWTESTHAVRHAKHRGTHPSTSTQSTIGTTASTASPASSSTTGSPAGTTTTSATTLKPASEDAAIIAPRNDSSAPGVGSSNAHAWNESHDECYDTTDVLYVIAVTCVINFAFVLFIMTWVRVSTSHAKVDSSEGSHTEWNGKRHSASRLFPSDSYGSVQEYVNSLPDIPFVQTSIRSGGRYQRRTLSMEDLLFV